MKITDLNKYRKEKNHQAVRIATAVLKHQARMKDHQEALKRIDEFYHD